MCVLWYDVCAEGRNDNSYLGQVVMFVSFLAKKLSLKVSVDRYDVLS